MHLKLVAGTAVPKVQQQTPELLSLATKSEPDTGKRLLMETEARRLICGLKPGVDNLTVSELLAEMNRDEPGGDVVATIQRDGVLRRALQGIGIHPHSALPDDDLDVTVYGLVIAPKKLLKACRDLKPFSVVLDGLTL